MERPRHVIGSELGNTPAVEGRELRLGQLAVHFTDGCCCFESAVKRPTTSCCGGGGGGAARGCVSRPPARAPPAALQSLLAPHPPRVVGRLLLSGSCVLTTSDFLPATSGKIVVFHIEDDGTDDEMKGR